MSLEGRRTARRLESGFPSPTNYTPTPVGSEALSKVSAHLKGIDDALGGSASGYSGYSGVSGYSGYSGVGVSGYSGYSGDAGSAGTSGYSGYSGLGYSGYSGYSGVGSSDYNGFVNRTDSSIAMNVGNFEITTGSSYDFYSGGTKYTKSTTQSAAISTNNTLHYVYFDSSGVLQVATSAWDILSDNVPVATVYRYGAGVRYAIGDERHYYKRDRAWHNWAHKSIFARYISGYTGTFTNTSLSLTQGVVADEDIFNDSGGTKTNCRLWYRNTGATSMAFEDAITTPYKVNAGAIQYDNAGTLTNVTAGSRVCNYIYGTNDPSYPIYVVVGQAQYTTLAQARNDPLPTLPGITTAEWKLLYRVIYTNVAGTPTYNEAADYRVVNTGPAGGTISATDHAVLTNRDATNQHPASAIQSALTPSQYTVAAADVDSHLTGIDAALRRSAEKITQASHGFVAGEALYYTGSAYAKAKADLTTTAEAVGIVGANPGTNDFILVYEGRIEGLSSLTAGSTYFLSDVTAGALSLTEPSMAGHISKPMLFATSTTSGVVVNMRGVTVPTAGVLGQTYVHVQSVASATWSVNHKLATNDVLVQVYDGTTGNMILPDAVDIVDASNLTITFSSSVTGKAVVIGSLGQTQGIQAGAADVQLQYVSTTQVKLIGMPDTTRAIEVNGYAVSVSSDKTVNTTDNILNSAGGDSGSATAVSNRYYAYVSCGLATFAPNGLRLSLTAPTSGYLGNSGNATNWRHVGDVWTDSSGNFGTIWTRFNEPTKPLTTAPLAMKNAIINGCMRLWQRGTSVTGQTGSVNSRIADRWGLYGVSVGATVRQDRSTTVPDSNTAYSLSVTVTTPDAATPTAGEVLHIYQVIEGYNLLPFVGKAVALSFWVNSSKTGTYCVRVTNGSGDRSFVAEYTVNSASTWEKKTIVVPMNAVGGTWDYTNGSGAYLCFALVAGSTWQTTANAWQNGNYFATANQVNWADAANTFYLANVQFELGNTATEFERRDYGRELILCQRYFQDYYTTVAQLFRITGYGYNTSSGLIHNFPLPVVMRAIPLATVYNGNNGGAPSSLTIAPETRFCVFTVNPTSAAQNMYYQWNMTLDAEF